MENEEKVELGHFLGGIEGIADFFRNAADGVKSLPVLDAIRTAVPWATAVGESVAESVAPIKFLVTLLKKVTQIRDAGELAALACAAAYQQAVIEAIERVPPPWPPSDLVEQMRLATKIFTASERIDYRTLSLSALESHAFLFEADRFLQVYAKAAGYSDHDLTRLTVEVHRAFRRTFRKVLVEGALHERLKPLREMLQLDNEVLAAHDFLERHAAYQRSLFDNAPLLKTEPFALKDVYIKTECGVMTWRQIEARIEEHGRPFDQFLDEEGGRHDLLTTVMSAIADPSFREAVVIEGVAGSGKSAFTLRLVAELLDRGLTPIRVRLRDVDLARSINEALGRAIDDRDSYAPAAGPRGPENPLLSGRIFEDAVPFEQATISRYVLILDGWDDISTSRSQAYSDQIERMLTQVRSEYLNLRRSTVRVILTGRPSKEVSASGFFRDDTLVLTLRAFTADQLEAFVQKLDEALRRKSVEGTASVWTAPPREKLAPVLAEYRNAPERLDILGQPLLAHIAMRLFALAEPIDLLADRTTLFRSLVDITCEKGGHVDALGPEGTASRARTRVRNLLQQTATAITIHGDEKIPLSELNRRLAIDSQRIMDAADDSESNHPLSRMVISFYLRGGHEARCEFLHKPFREYLHAEHIVERLKEFGRAVRTLPPERPREDDWKDFDDGDPRRGLSRDLMRMAAAQWITAEVGAYLNALIGWEIGRATGRVAPHAFGAPTAPVGLAAWEIVRDALADLWDWWGEAVHLRPQPRRNKEGRIEFERSAADEIVEWCAARPAHPHALPTPIRITRVDAHIGEVLFRLAARVHYAINEATGWNPPHLSAEEVWTPREKRGAGCRRYQARVRGQWIVFAPSGPGRWYFSDYAARMRAAGRISNGPFPSGLDCRGLDLSDAYLLLPPRRGRACDWSDCSFREVVGNWNDFGGDALIRIHAPAAHSQGANFSSALLRRADLTQASLIDSHFRDCDATGAVLTGAVLDRSDWTNAVVEGVVRT